MYIEDDSRYQPPPLDNGADMDSDSVIRAAVAVMFIVIVCVGFLAVAVAKGCS